MAECNSVVDEEITSSRLTTETVGDEGGTSSLLTTETVAIPASLPQLDNDVQVTANEAAESAVSSETEGPDTHSVLSSSGETGGPDTDISLSDNEDAVITHDDCHRGMVIKQGDLVSFVADNLNEKIKLSSPTQSAASRGSRRSSLTSDACSTSNLEQHPPCHKVLADIETQAKNLGRSVDKMLNDLQTNLHSMSAITVGCMQTYKGSVDKTLDEVDANIKLMYTLMARCDELSGKMKDVYPIADEINDIKRILDMFESDLLLSPS